MTEEKKTKRGNLLFTPTVYSDIQILADIDGTSLNDYLHELARVEADRRRTEINAKREILAIKNKMINSLGNLSIEDQQEMMQQVQKMQEIIDNAKNNG